MNTPSPTKLAFDDTLRIEYRVHAFSNDGTLLDFGGIFDLPRAMDIGSGGYHTVQFFTQMAETMFRENLQAQFTMAWNRRHSERLAALNNAAAPPEAASKPHQASEAAEEPTPRHDRLAHLLTDIQPRLDNSGPTRVREKVAA